MPIGVTEGMRIDRIDRDLLALLGLFALAVYCAASAFSYGTLQWGDVLSSYFVMGVVATAAGIIAVIGRCTLQAGRAHTSALAEVRKGLGDLRLWAWLTIPGLIAPIFLASFTIAKILIGKKLGFTWDPFFANLDADIFGTDPWRLAHAIIGTQFGTNILEACYVGWGLALVLSMPLVIALASRDHAAKFLLAMLLTWVIAGLCFAAVFASAGPCFAYLFSPALSDRFKPMTDQLTLMLGHDDVIHQTQTYLAAYWNAPVAVKGGGISAFPSVHVGVAALYAIAAWRRPTLRLTTILYALTIWIGSIYFGYHYAVDGIASLGIAYGSWVIAGKTVALIVNRHHRSTALA